MRLAAEIEKGTAIENQPARWRGVARNLILKHWLKWQTTKVVADSEVKGNVVKGILAQRVSSELITFKKLTARSVWMRLSSP